MTASASASAAAVNHLAARFWAWRLRQQPASGDDVPRRERPKDWSPDWSPAAIARYRRELVEFEAEYSTLAIPVPVPDLVDYRLLGSALARVRWELEILRRWQVDPGFYVDQSLGPVFDLLLATAPFDAERAAKVVDRLADIPRTLDDARTNLDGGASAGFAQSAAHRLSDIGPQLTAATQALAPYLPDREARLLPTVARSAAKALEDYRDHFAATAHELPPITAIGRTGLCYFLHKVALIPFTLGELVDLGRREFDRAVTLEALERHRYQAYPQPELPQDIETQLERQRADERRVRAFYERRGLLSQPESLSHYLNARFPPYLQPLARLGVTDDLTSPERLTDDAVSYIPEPAEDLPYFDRANLFDPRLGIAHEGAHYQQLALSWSNPRPARRHYYDSAPNEGLACYNEDLLLTSGLYEDNPRCRAWVYNFMRVRALRVEVDVGLAVGDLDVEAASNLLREKGSVDQSTAEQEALFYASTPGQALSYQTGKTQVLGLVADTVQRDGDAFDPRALHDYLWRNGNVPLALLSLEYLGDKTALNRADALARREFTGDGCVSPSAP